MSYVQISLNVLQKKIHNVKKIDVFYRSENNRKPVN